tara:strand:+ start:79 stop:654 length:576 start_codon:yes stop_codon:yes gene_type:complete
MITIGLAYTIEDAVADVTSSGATTTQSNVSGSNTSIQGYEATTNNTYQGQVTNSTTNSTSNSTNQETAVNSATSPSMSIYGQDSCVIPLSIGMTVIGFSTSMGTYYHDEKCERRKKAKLLNALGMKVASISLMCQDKDVWLSMKMAGTVCPVDGLIGAEAEKRWQELGNEKYFDTIANTDNSKFRHHRKSP